MNDLQIFNNEEFGEIRTFQLNDEPWFVASDVCKALEIVNTTSALERLDDDEKSRFNLGLSGGESNCVNEYGLYTLILGSRKREAKEFKRWITHEVIPQIRKTGGYNLPQTLPEALRAYALEIEAKEKLAAENKLLIEKNAELEPKGIFYDAVTQSNQTTDMADVAKILDMGIGRNKLFAILREKKILQPDNKPYQKYIDQGYFKLAEEKFDKPDGVGIYYKTVVKQKGIEFIRRTLEELI